MDTCASCFHPIESDPVIIDGLAYHHDCAHGTEESVEQTPSAFVDNGLTNMIGTGLGSTTTVRVISGGFVPHTPEPLQLETPEANTTPLDIKP